MIHIIAPNQGQARQLAEINGLAFWQWRYTHSEYQLRGTRSPEVWLHADACQRDNLRELLQEARTRDAVILKSHEISQRSPALGALYATFA